MANLTLGAQPPPSDPDCTVPDPVNLNRAETVPGDDTRFVQAEKRSQAALYASELRYRRLFEAARDGILILEVVTGRISDVNPFLVQLLGFSHSEMIGKTVAELSPFKDIESNEAMLQKLQTNGYVRYDNLPLETRNGRKIAVEFVSNVYESGGHNVIQCNVRDITERKHAEADLIRLAAIVESSHDAIIGYDLKSIITNWNKGAELIFGYPAGEIVGTSIERLIPSSRQGADAQIRGIVRCGESVEQFETVRQARDGRLIDVSVTLSPITDAAGAIIGFSKTVRNITDRKLAEEKIHRFNLELEQRVVERTAELQAANGELEAFSYSVSHDLRAPLRHIIGFVQMLQKEAGPALSEKSLGRITVISEAANRMGKLIDDLLAFSRIGRAELQKAEVHLNELVREVIAELQPETKGRKIVWDIHPLPPVRADQSLLRMVFVNLIANAIKFTSQRPAAKIEIGSAPGSERETVIFIRDNGAGFEPQYASKLFGVFQRLHSQSEFEGTGIGLANVGRIIHRHSGRVWAEGVVDAGATFYFSILKSIEP